MGRHRRPIIKNALRGIAAAFRELWRALIGRICPYCGHGKGEHALDGCCGPPGEIGCEWRCRIYWGDRT